MNLREEMEAIIADTLTPREQKIIRLEYGFDDGGCRASEHTVSKILEKLIQNSDFKRLARSPELRLFDMMSMIRFAKLLKLLLADNPQFMGRKGR